MQFRQKKYASNWFKDIVFTPNKALIFTKKRAFIKYSGVWWGYVGENM